MRHASADALDRREAVRALLARRGEALVVAGLGNPTYDVAAAGDDDRNFYLWGAMGGTAMVGLGLALAQRARPVIVMTGDGDMLMGLSSLATIGLAAPKNLAIVVVDNGRFGETGGQPSHTAGGTDLAAVAAACGFPETWTVRTMAEAEALAPRLARPGGGPLFATVKVAAASHPRVMPARDGAYLKARFRLALGLPVE